jgi:peptidoglycan-associated lipoprotein
MFQSLKYCNCNYIIQRNIQFLLDGARSLITVFIWRELQKERKVTLQKLAFAAALAGACLAGGCTKRVVVAPAATPTAAPKTEIAQAPSQPQVAEKVVSQPARPTPARYPDAATRQKIEELLSRIQDAYFDYDKHSLRADAVSTLNADAKTLSDILVQYPDFKLRVEGYTDERGSDEYNLALGDARAQKTKEYLVNLGLPGAQMDVVSYGKEHPVCTEQNENCWQKNRRAHVTTADSRAHQ